MAAPTIAAGAGSVWVSNGVAGVVSRLELQSEDVVRTIELRSEREKAIAGFVAASPTDVWVVGGRVSARRPRPLKASPPPLLLWRIDPRTNKVIRAVQLEGSVLGLRPDLAAAVVGDSLWLLSDSGIVRFDRRSGRVRSRLALASYANVPENGRLATGAGSLWVPDIHNSVVWRVDLATEKRVASIHVRGQPAGVAFGGGAAWVADANRAEILKVDPSTNEVVARIPVDGAPNGLAFGFGRLWVALG